MSNPRNIRKYAAGAALCFGIVLLVFQVVGLAFLGRTKAEMAVYENLLTILYVGVHLVGGFLGSYLVSRSVEEDHFTVGVVTVVLGYLFESMYFLLFGDRSVGDIVVLGSLLVGGALGANYARGWREKQGLEVRTSRRTARQAEPEKNEEKTAPEPGETEKTPEPQKDGEK